MNDCLRYYPNATFCTYSPQVTTGGTYGQYSESCLQTMRSVLHDKKSLFFARVFFDNVFYILVCIVTINMIAGII